MSNSTLPYTLRRIWWHLTPRRRGQCYVQFLVVILASFAEVISIGAVLPFFGALTAPEQMFNHPLAQPFIHALSLTEPEQLLLPLTIVFALGAVGSGLMRFIYQIFKAKIRH